MSTVDGAGFKHFLKVTCPHYVIPSRNTIKNKLVDKYLYFSSKFKHRLQSKKHFSLTSDIWTDIQMKSFLGVTIHFLENNTFVSGNIFKKDPSKIMVIGYNYIFYLLQFRNIRCVRTRSVSYI